MRIKSSFSSLIVFAVLSVVILPQVSFSQFKKDSFVNGLDASDSSSEYLSRIRLKKEKPPEKNKINYIKFGSLSAFTVGMSIGLHELQRRAWWSGQRGPFHIQNDWSYALSMDKIGHFMEGGLIHKTMRDGFLWSGFDEKSASWLGALFSIAYMTNIEIEDGFATQWGYSIGDELANLSGDIFSVAQDLWNPLQTVKIKWSYVPTNDPNHKGDFPDDYSGQVFWLSFDVNSYLPPKFEKPWPDWLNLALGYGVTDYENYGPGGRQQYFYLGLDYDLRKIIPGDSKFMKGLKEFLNTFKIVPTPAFRYNITSRKFEFVIR